MEGQAVTRYGGAINTEGNVTPVRQWKARRVGGTEPRDILFKPHRNGSRRRLAPRGVPIGRHAPQIAGP